MGYSTDFEGSFKFNKTLDVETMNALNKFSEDDHREEDKGFPGIWCQWIPTEDGKCLEWDEGEKFYNYVEWLEYLIKEFLAPKGYVLNGEVEWTGEENGDIGLIIVKDNIVTTKEGKIVYD